MDESPIFGMNHAEFASDVYLPVESRRKKIYNMELQSHQSDLYHSVYLDHQTKAMHMSIRGTFPSHIPDLKADEAIITGRELENERFKLSMEKFREMKEFYKDYSQSVSGHSLAGHIVTEIIAEHGVEGHAYNPGVAGPQAMRKLGCRSVTSSTKGCQNQKNSLHLYYVRKGVIIDPVSEVGRLIDNSQDGLILGSSAKKVKVVNWNRNKASHPHALENYL